MIRPLESVGVAIKPLRCSRGPVLLVAGAILLAACHTPTEHPIAGGFHQGQAEVTALIGRAFYSRPGSDWASLAVGTSLQRGDILRTEAGSEVDLRFFKTGPVARVKPLSEVKFVRMERMGWTNRSPSVTQLELNRGRILVDDKELPPGSKFEVNTPDGTAFSQGQPE